MKPEQAKTTSTLWIDAGQPHPISLPFECQPLFTCTGEVYGIELLYRGIIPKSWAQVDTSVLRYLGRHSLDMPRVFVNVANESLLTIPDDTFVLASQKNEIVFELSEVFARGHTVAVVAAKVNRLISRGVRFAIDDFGGGADGMHRMYSIDKVVCVKVDGAFLRICQARGDAAAALRCLITDWKSRGITVVAEWIETADLLSFAHSMDFDLTQGWYVDELYAWKPEQVDAA